MTILGRLEKQLIETRCGPHVEALPSANPGRLAGGDRLLKGTAGSRRLDLPAHLSMHGELAREVWSGDVDPLDLAERVDLRGRGGAAFPFARKARGVRECRGRALVVGNGSEGEPASLKDATLMRLAPHLVLDGLELAAVNVGAREARVVIGDETARRSVLEALSERRQLRRSRVRIAVMAIDDRFVAGESTAVVRASEGGPAGVPKFTVKRTGEGGVNGRPTLVSNVETLGHFALLARLGADGYRSVGTEWEAGTTLLTTYLAGSAPTVIEVPYGQRLGEILGDGSNARAVLVGGYHGQWLAPGVAEGTVISRAGLKDANGDLGAGVIVALPDDACPLVEAAPVVRMLADASSGQCGPCVHGLRSIADRIQALADGAAVQEDLLLLDRWAKLVRGRGACSHPDGVVRFVGSLLTAFASEVAVHQHFRCGRAFQGLLPVEVAS